jgi:transposase, IS5 family
MVQQTKQVVSALGEHTQMQAQKLTSLAQEVLPRVEQVIKQTRTRVLEGKKVASDEKVISLFEPHTRAIPRHKRAAEVEFGRQVMLDEVDGGIVTRYEILPRPDEHGQAVEAVEHHKTVFTHPPRLVTADRGVYSAETEEKLRAAGVKQTAIPTMGKGSEERQALEHTRSFRRRYRWRAGIEGRIHSLRRDYGLLRCEYHGEDGMERWIGLGLVASNLHHIAQASAA